MRKILCIISPSQFLYESPAKANVLTGVINKLQQISDTVSGTLDQIVEFVKNAKTVTEAVAKKVATSLQTFVKGGTKHYNHNGKTFTKEEVLKTLTPSIFQNSSLFTINADGSKITANVSEHE
ncbi:hypothetical protein [Spiroplasma endosymbiont of Ammophila pubescens]|uniref:hypothetical protein n=1 Tax=Spiroplasma endosymbiont of Ammophila pubescens TaxID=3066315 RepID=UPI0032B2E2CD